MIDADTAQFRSIPIADPIDRILLFPPGDGSPHEALFASIAAGWPRLWVLDLDHFADPLAQVATARGRSASACASRPATSPRRASG